MHNTKKYTQHIFIFSVSTMKHYLLAIAFMIISSESRQIIETFNTNTIEDGPYGGKKFQK